MIVHGNLFPDTHSQEIHCIFMPGSHARHGYRLCFRIKTPLIKTNFLPCGTVKHLPEFLRVILFIYDKLFFEISLHQRNHYGIRLCHHRNAHKEVLLQLIHIVLRPCIVGTDDTDGGIDSVSCTCNFIRKFCTITVTDHIRPPFLCHTKRKIFISGFSWKRKAALCKICHFFFLLLSLLPRNGTNMYRSAA